MLERERLPRFTASLTAFGFSATQTALFALYPFLAEKLGLSIGAIIASFSFGSFLYLFGSPYWSAKSDQRGRIQVLRFGSIGLLFSFAFLAALVVAPPASPLLGFALLILSRGIYGVFASSIPPVAQSLQADTDEIGDPMSDSRSAMFRHSISLSAGRVFSLLLLVLAPISITSTLAILLLLIATSVATLFIQSSAPSTPALGNSTERSKLPNPFRSWSALASLKGVLSIAFLFTLFIEALNSSFAATLQRTLSLDSLSTSRVAAQLLLGVSIGILLVQTFAKRFSALNGIAGFGAGLSALFAGAISFSQADSITAYWLSILFLSVGIGILPPLYLTLLKTIRSPLSYGARAGWIASIHTLGYSSGGLVAAAGLSFGIPLGYALGGSVLAMSVAFFWTLRSLSSATPESPSEASA